jgi:hypothetical protein
MSTFDDRISAIAGTAEKDATETAAVVVANAPKAAGFLGRILGGIWKAIKVPAKVLAFVAKPIVWILKKVPGVASIGGLAFNFVPGVGWIKTAWAFVKSPAFKLLLAVAVALGSAAWASVKTHQYDTATEQLATAKANVKAAEDQRQAAERVAAADAVGIAALKQQNSASAAKAKDLTNAAAKIPHAADPVFPGPFASQLRQYLNGH